MNKTIISITVLTLCAIYSITPLIIRPEIARGTDILYHLYWASQISSGLKEGILYPRWFSESNNSYGSPIGIFYSPLFHWLTGVVNLFIPSMIVSLKVTIFTGFLLSGISMYIFLRNFCNHVGCVAGGIAYQLLPYQILDLYVRGTLAEFFSFFWLPLILHFAYKGFKEDTSLHWLGLSFSYAGLILTHIASAYILTFVVVATALSLSLRGKSFRLLLKFIVAFFFGLSLSAVYFMPMFFERKFVHIEWLKEWPLDYTRGFLYAAETSRNPHWDSLYIQLELIVMLQVLLVLTSMILIYYRSRRYGNLSNSHEFLFFSWLFAFSIFLSTSPSTPLWSIIPGLPTIQFPWRWLMVTTLATSVLIGLTFNTFSFEDIKRDRFVRIFTAMFHAFVIGSIGLSSLYIMTTEPVQKKDIEWMSKGGGDVIEYRPIWLTKKRQDFSGEKRTYVIFKKGEGGIDIVSWKSHSRHFTVNASISSTLRVSTFYYPGWTALINGREIPIEIEKDSGAMLLNLPPGKNEVLLEFRDTPLRRGAKWISIFSLFTAFLIMVLVMQKGRFHKNE